MNETALRILPLPKECDKEVRARFCSRSAPLNEYFQNRVTQDIRRCVTKCYVAILDDKIVGYYTLASMSLRLQEFPEELRKKMPRYPEVPAYLVGRLAVDEDFEGRGIGPKLLVDALMKAIESSAGNYALVVEAKDARSEDFYLRRNFIPLGNQKRTLFYPLKDAKASFGSQG